MKLLVVDGSNLLFQMFFGMPSRIVNSQGKAIQGTLGFVGALIKIIRLTDPTHVVAVFDGEHKNARKDLDEEYKANRPDFSQTAEAETPFSQLEDVYRALDFMGIKHKETEDCESDDWIASYALKYGEGNEVVIASFDSDFFQLITPSVSVLRYRGENTKIWTPADVEEKFGIFPDKYADFKSLTGDTSDNIKGAPKVGPKTAAALIAEFGTLEKIISAAETIKKPSIRESIMASKDRLDINYRLIKLGSKAPLPFEISDLKYTPSNHTTTSVLKSIGVM